MDSAILPVGEREPLLEEEISGSGNGSLFSAGSLVSAGIFAFPFLPLRETFGGLSASDWVASGFFSSVYLKEYFNRKVISLIMALGVY